MPTEKKSLIKTKLHPRNKNREQYDLTALKKSTPELKQYITLNKFGTESIKFSNPLAVKQLNKAILNFYYGIKHWDFPDENLCPPIPGRADYIHYMADLLSECNLCKIPTGEKIRGLDIGIGASCIYPIIGASEYGWKFIGSDISPKSIASSQKIINANSSIKHKIDCRLQNNSKHIFQNIIGKDERIDFTLCNPPFHTSLADAQRGTRRKIKNLSGKKVTSPELNFAGISNELICDGGELTFIQNMIQESKHFSKNCLWFSSLVSKEENLKGIYKSLKHVNAVQVKTIPMGTGNKSSRIVAWTFLSKEEQNQWRVARWKSNFSR